MLCLFPEGVPPHWSKWLRMPEYASGSGASAWFVSSHVRSSVSAEVQRFT
ncbi:MAG: hypothetical protein IPJ00_20585 [Saprospirales bacterium]|nr:hypothetical protein [Saprospirales bacterium]